ncbi:MAG: ABC transporter ATP-binding protein/permease [Deltaproteobacteria bacterium]|nr:ABC transporter ATP-binding protein/permease [Deltaproteobacteria bacterium]MBW2072591.1 ABC transporter ATP-binding protein/permease [Deltaproteobacteria bacterium]
MAKTYKRVVDKSLFSWVRESNLKLQVILILVILVTVAARVFPLEMQKKIVNEAIGLRQINLLFLYCGLYLVAVVSAGALKYLINVLQTYIGQSALANMRQQLYHHILTLPLSFFRKTQPGLVVTVLVNELASPGDFVGMAVAVPVTNLLTLLGFGAYLFWLNPLLAVISFTIYPFVVFLVPILQKRANEQNKKRIDASRKLSGKIAEAISGVHEIHANGAYRIENQKYDRLVDNLRRIRIVWNLYRYGVKACNNFFTNLSPFLVFIVGGYLAIKGRFDLGSLVAFLSAQEKLYDPIRELTDFYQAYQNASVTYKRTMSYFDVQPDYVLEPRDRQPYSFTGNIEVRNLSFHVDGVQLLDRVNFSLSPGEHMALVGFSGSGKSTLGLCIGQLYKYTGGQVLIDGHAVADLSKADIVNNVGFVSQTPFIFEGSFRENLLYSCAAQVAADLEQAAADAPSRDTIIEVLQQTGIFVDVLNFGMNTILAYDQHQDLAAKLIELRRDFQRDFGSQLADYVEFFNEDNYLYHSTVSSNITFGAARDPSFEVANLPRNPYFLEFLDEADLYRPLVNLGAELCQQTVDILGSLPAEEVFFEQSPIRPDEIEVFKELAASMQKRKLHQLPPAENTRLLELALRFIPARHKMVAFPHILEQLLLEGRELFKEKISREKPGAFSFYDMSQYIYSQTILENILFGKPSTTTPQGLEKIHQSLIHLLIDQDLLETIIEIGIEYNVGSKGDKLSGGQRQKLAIARIFLKAPRIMIMDEATSALDARSQARIQRLLETKWRGYTTLIAVIHRLDIIKSYDKIGVMKAGRLVEIGTYDELMAKKGMLYELIHGKH